MVQWEECCKCQFLCQEMLITAVGLEIVVKKQEMEVSKKVL